MKEIFVLFDQIIHDWFLLLRGDELTIFFKYITQLGEWKYILPVALGVSVILYFRKGRHLFILPFWLSFLSASATTLALKLFIARPRPFPGLIVEHGSSFPSAHATIAVAVYGLFMYLILTSTRSRWIQIAIVFIGLSLILAIGVSRLYLGVHYTSDVVAGYLIGLAGLLFGAFVHSRYTETKSG